MENTRTIICPNAECRREYAVATFIGGFVSIGGGLQLRWHGPRRLNIRCRCGQVMAWGANRDEQTQAEQVAGKVGATAA